MAAKLTKYPLRGLNTKEVVKVVGSFTPDTNTTYPHTVALTSNNGAQFTVVKTAAGTYQVRMLDTYSKAAICASTQTIGVLPSAATGAALQVMPSTYTVATQTQVLRLYNPASALVASDVTAVEPSSVPAGTVVCFELAFRVTGSPD